MREPAQDRVAPGPARKRDRAPALAPGLLLLALWSVPGCDAVTRGVGPDAAARVTVSPPSGSVAACGTLTFAASVTGASSADVTWSVTESGGGSITSAGLYTAPPKPGTYHVVARSSVFAPAKAWATVTVAEQILNVAITPTSTWVEEGRSTQLTASVTTSCGTFTVPP
jgi:hypothetical protein